MHLDKKKQLCFGFECETDGGRCWQARDHPGSWLVCWWGISLVLVSAWWHLCHKYHTGQAQSKQRFIAGITLILDSIRRRDAVCLWVSTANCSTGQLGLWYAFPFSLFFHLLCRRLTDFNYLLSSSDTKLLIHTNVAQQPFLPPKFGIFVKQSAEFCLAANSCTINGAERWWWNRCSGLWYLNECAAIFLNPPSGFIGKNLKCISVNNERCYTVIEGHDNNLSHKENSLTHLVVSVRHNAIR